MDKVYEKRQEGKRKQMQQTGTEYNGSERCNGNKKYGIQYIGLLFMLLMLNKTVSKPCSESHVCLTWKIQNSSLVLICRVDTKNNFPITFYDPFHNETGFCVHVKCQSLLPNAVIKTIDTTNTVITLQEIVFTIPLKVQLNGWWTCTHGHNNSEAVTEVTIQDIHLNTNSGYRNTIECWCLIMLWSWFGFGCSWLLVRLIKIFVTCHQNKNKKKEYATLTNPFKDPYKWEDFLEYVSKQERHQEHKAALKINNEDIDEIEILNEHVSGDERQSEHSAVIETTKGIDELNDFIRNVSRKQRTPVWKNVIVFLLSSSLFALPLIVGLIQVEQCKAARAFSIYGAIVGIIIFCLLMNRGKTKNTVKNRKISSNGKTDNIEMRNLKDKNANND